MIFFMASTSLFRLASGLGTVLMPGFPLCVEQYGGTTKSSKPYHCLSLIPKIGHFGADIEDRNCEFPQWSVWEIGEQEAPVQAGRTLWTERYEVHQHTQTWSQAWWWSCNCGEHREVFNLKTKCSYPKVSWGCMGPHEAWKYQWENNKNYYLFFFTARLCQQEKLSIWLSLFNLYSILSLILGL